MSAIADDGSLDDDLGALLRSAFALRPGAAAIRDGDVVITYRELEALAGEIATALRRRIPAGEAVVAVEIERSWRLVVATVAIVVAGFAFAVIDPALPALRRAQMLEKAEPDAIVYWERGEAARIEGDRAGARAPAPAETDRRLAYVIFTSGSTGIPKAAAIERRSLAVFVRWHLRTYGDAGGWRAAQIAAPIFDVFVWDVFGTLAGGAELCIVYEQDFDPQSLWLRLAELDVAHVPPALVHMLFAEADMQPASMRLRHLLTGGERLLGRPTRPRTWRFNDHYGPAECTIIVTSTVTVDDVGNVPIGIVGGPIDGTHISIVDDALAPVADGEPGEVLISGVLVGRGYLNDAEQTAKVFVRDLPFLPAGAVAYRTGDVGRLVGPYGLLEFHGRRDDQVKVNGYRIELGDVESALYSHPNVRDAVAGVGNAGHGNYLVAVVAVGDASSAGLADDVRRHAAERLPQYMLPSRLHLVEAFPKMENGKIDRKSLLARFA